MRSRCSPDVRSKQAIPDKRKHLKKKKKEKAPILELPSSWIVAIENK